MKELEKTYNPAEIEDRLYDKWLKGKYFHAEVNRSKKPFTIVMPPPNITGQLHIRHALDNTMQDILIRSKRIRILSISLVRFRSTVLRQTKYICWLWIQS